VRDAHGKTLGRSGVDHETDASEPGVHILKAVQLDENGQPRDTRETHLFRAVVYNHTLPARDAAVIQFAIALPPRWDEGDLPLRVRARLRHRSRNLPLQEASCRDAHTPRGEAFLEASRRLTGTALDPCAPQPITDIAVTEIELGEGALPLAGAAPLWQRLYDHGLGLSHALQERLDEARPSLERAIELAPGPRERAMGLGALAQVAARQGRLDEALGLVDRACPLVDDEPALSRTRGEAFAQVWRWSEAVEPLSQAVRGAPLDDAGLAQLALALGSAGDPERALAVAREGLALQPRDPDLLRIQSLSATALGSPDAARAREAFLAWRVPDDGPRFRAACSRTIPGCAIERTPVHTHWLK
jgi:tetratricopeptide (TPR) repeat protein